MGHGEPADSGPAAHMSICLSQKQRHLDHHKGRAKCMLWKERLECADEPPDVAGSKELLTAALLSARID